jgi:hypothetical protein
VPPGYARCARVNIGSRGKARRLAASRRSLALPKFENKNREEQANMLHKAQELKWVVLWILVTVFVFAIFIPTINRALNL